MHMIPCTISVSEWRTDCRRLHCRVVFASAPKHAQHPGRRAQNPAQSRYMRCRFSSSSWLGASAASPLRGDVLCITRLCIMGGLPPRWSAGASLRSSALSSRKQRQVEMTYFAYSNSTCCRYSTSSWLGLSSFSALHGEAF